MDLKRMERRLEPTLKLLGALGVVLYVVGLVISNLHLMELGISEFASFNLRNATTGFVFLAWIGLIMLLVSPGSLFLIVAIATVDAKLRWKRTAAVIAVALLAAAVLTIGVLEVVGRTIRYAYPWGQPWQFMETPRSLMDFITMKSTREAWGFAQAGFGNAKTIVAGAALLGMLAAFAYRPVVRYMAAKTKIGIKASSVDESINDVNLSLGISSPLILVMLMSAFAVHVLPNLRGNIGGHQPQIALIGLQEARSAGLGFDVSREIAIWHQTDKFLYLTPLYTPATGNRGERQDLIALDISLVETIRYLRRYARVVDGARIVQVGVPPTG
jgi:hypothetical protein